MIFQIKTKEITPPPMDRKDSKQNTLEINQ